MNYKDLSTIAMDNIDFICYISDLKTYKILYLNKTAKKIFDFHDDTSYKNMHCHTIMYGFDTPCPFCNNDQLTWDKQIVLEKKLFKNNKDYSFQSTLINIGGTPAKLTMAFDISKLLGQLNSLEEKLSLEETLLSCIQTFMNDDNIDIAITKLLAIIGTFYQADRASLFSVDFKANNIFHTYEWSLTPEHSISAQKPTIELKHLSELFKTFEEKGELYIADIHKELQSNTRLYQVLNLAQVNSVILVPLYINNILTFFIGIDNPQQNMNNFTLLHSVVLFINEEIKKRRIIEELEYLSYIDNLTGLYNRNKYLIRLEELKTQPLDSVGVIHADANALKRVNDLYGVQHGDSMLKNIAQTLSQFIPNELYRIAGDEFIGFCINISQEEFETIVQTIRKEYATNIDSPFSVGAVWQDKKINIPLAVMQSGEIMLAEKQEYYKKISPDSVQYNSHSGENILREIHDGRYNIYLQPKVDLKNGLIVGAEALIRKFDNHGKPISPDQFVPLYEHEGTIRYIDFFVFETVCLLLQQLIKEQRPLKIAVNFSRVTFMAYDLLDELIKICATYSVPHEYIKIEITESIDKMDFDFFAKKLSAIHHAGFDVSLDDFGAKHSNLMMLSRAEFTEVKIDKGLIDNIVSSANNRTIIRNIIKIIKELGTSVCVAEGIETKEQKEILQEQGCTYGQGYYFYKPLPIDEFLNVYQKNERQEIFILNSVTSEALQKYTLPDNLIIAALESMPFGMNVWNHKLESVLCNQKVVELFELSSKEEYLTNFSHLSPEFQPDGTPTSEAVLYYMNEARYNGFVEFPWMHCKLNGEEIPTEITLCKLDVKNEEGEAFIVGYTRDLRPNNKNK